MENGESEKETNEPLNTGKEGEKESKKEFESHPRSMKFAPRGRMLFKERTGQGNSKNNSNEGIASISPKAVERGRMEFPTPPPKSPEKDANPLEKTASTQTNTSNQKAPKEQWRVSRGRMEFKKRTGQGSRTNNKCSIS
ncbi:uncharacterized protein [Pocillopora verrucosa]|uniref:uncharacterized protein isoform X1 n=1 Tax=Pocillopora verrucosa TaxID=203993 RepID=UPI0033402631